MSIAILKGTAFLSKSDSQCDGGGHDFVHSGKRSYLYCSSVRRVAKHKCCCHHRSLFFIYRDLGSQAFGNELFGRPDPTFFTSLLCLSCLGALNATVFSAGRLTQAASRRRYIPFFLGAATEPNDAIRRDARDYKTMRGLLNWLITGSVVPATRMFLCMGQPSSPIESIKHGFSPYKLDF